MTKIFSLLPIALAGLCFQAATADAAPATGPRDQQQLRYTSIAPVRPAKAVEVIPVRIDVQFNAGERAKIVEAVRHWNHALNGQVRLDVATQPYNVNAPSNSAGAAPTARNTWTVARVSGTGVSPIPGRGPQLGTLAQAQELTNGGGMVVVFADKIGQRDLAQIMLHELGHVLGLGHENAGRLMSPHYAGNAQQCIDKGAMQAVAQIKRLTFQALNWCGDAASIAAANRTQGRVAAR
jgi:hypothetical protein